jgi:fumarate reductase subunit D
MARSQEPVVWGLFAAGGTLTALLTPALLLLTLLAALGRPPELLEYDHLRALAAHWAGKLALFGIVFLSLWHAAHRFRTTIHDFGVRARARVALLAYAVAAVGTVATIAFLWRI